MEKHETWIKSHGPNSRSLLWAVCLALTLMVSTQALAHGTKVHEGPTPPPAVADDMATDADIAVEEPAFELSAPSAHEEGAHAHGGEDNHGAEATEDIHDHSAHEHNEAPLEVERAATEDAHGHGEAATEDAHDHSAHAPNQALLESGFGRLLVWIGKFHPAAVHFPIALLLGAALAELLSLRFNDGFFRGAVRYSLWLGALGALGAALLGWLYGGFHLVDEESVLTYHRWNGTGIAALALLTLWLGERRARKSSGHSGAFRTALFATALLVGLNGYWGGLMVHGAEQHQWPTAPTEHAH